METTEQVLNQETASNQVLAKETETDVSTKENQDQEKSYTQSEFDKAVTKALETRERKINDELVAEREQVETEKLIEKNKFEELYRRSEEQRKQSELKTKTNSYLRDNNLLNLSDVFEFDNSTLDGRIQTANTIQKMVDKLVEDRVSKTVDERLDTPSPVKAANHVSLKDRDISTLSVQELKSLKAEMGMKDIRPYGIN